MGPGCVFLPHSSRLHPDFRQVADHLGKHRLIRRTQLASRTNGERGTNNHTNHYISSNQPVGPQWSPKLPASLFLIRPFFSGAQPTHLNARFFFGAWVVGDAGQKLVEADLGCFEAVQKENDLVDSFFGERIFGRNFLLVAFVRGADGL